MVFGDAGKKVLDFHRLSHQQKKNDQQTLQHLPSPTMGIWSDAGSKRVGIR
jgi:hypothetical protein